jgi:hypothetical protein
MGKYQSTSFFCSIALLDPARCNGEGMFKVQGKQADFRFRFRHALRWRMICSDPPIFKLKKEA